MTRAMASNEVLSMRPGAAKRVVRAACAANTARGVKKALAQRDREASR